jgi:hypothetical protein
LINSDIRLLMAGLRLARLVAEAEHADKGQLKAFSGSRLTMHMALRYEHTLYSFPGKAALQGMSAR